MVKKNRTKQWLKRHVSDAYVRKAKKSGLRARSAFKLSEIKERFHLFRPGDAVIELGSAPGGWTQSIVQWVGNQGLVVALDLLPMGAVSGARFIQGDCTDEAIVAAVSDHLSLNRSQSKVQLVVSDMAPNLSGDRCRDQANAERLWQMVMDYCTRFLSRGGAMVIKLFHGEAFETFIGTVRLHFDCVNIVKPDASRKESREVYLVAIDYRGE